MNRRQLLFLAASGLVAGCGDSRLGRMVATAQHFAGTAPGSVADVARARDLPYASLAAKIGRRGPLSVLVLGVVQEQDLSWFSADRAVVITRGGRVIKTAGLPYNLRKTIYLHEDPLRLGPGGADGRAWRRLVDLDRGQRFGVSVQARLRVKDAEDIDNFGLRHRVVRVEEECRAIEADWTFTNTFWLDAGNGYVWRSRQHFDPLSPPIDMWVLKPAGTG